MKHAIKDWIIATRPWSFPASAMPVLVTLGYLFWSGAPLNWAVGIFTMQLLQPYMRWYMRGRAILCSLWRPLWQERPGA